MRWLLLVVMAVAGCGEGGEGETRVPEDYLPEGVSLEGLTEAQQICTLHRQVTYARWGECDPMGPIDWRPAVTDPMDIFDQSMVSCTHPSHTMDVYKDSHVRRCLSHRAAARCEDLVGPKDDPAFPLCELVAPSW